MARSRSDMYVRLRLEPSGKAVPGMSEHTRRNCYVMVPGGAGLEDDELVALALTSLTNECGSPLDLLLRDHMLETEVVDATTVTHRDARATHGLFFLPAAGDPSTFELDAVREALAARGTGSPRP